MHTTKEKSREELALQMHKQRSQAAAIQRQQRMCGGSITFHTWRADHPAGGEHRRNATGLLALF